MTRPRKEPQPYPKATDFAVGDRLITVKEVDPKVPAGTAGEVMMVKPDTNEIWVQWNIQKWPYIKVTKGSPTHGYKKVGT